MVARFSRFIAGPACLVLCLLICNFSITPVRAEDDPNDDSSKKKMKKDEAAFEPDSLQNRGFGLTQKKFSNKDADLTPEQVRDKTMKQIKEQQDKAIKEEEKYAKKHANDKDKKTADKGDGLDSDMNIYTKRGAQTIELDATRDNKGRTQPIRIAKDAPVNTQPNVLEMNGPKNKNVKNGTLELEGGLGNPNAKQDFKTTGNNAELSDADKPHKVGFFERMFGSKKKEEDMKAQGKGTDGNVDVKLGSAAAAPTAQLPHAELGSHDTVLHRVEAEMARKRLNEEIAARGKEQAAPENSDKTADKAAHPSAEAKGEVVELPIPPPAVSSDIGKAAATRPAALQNPTVAAIEGAEPPATATSATAGSDPSSDAAPATPADVKAASEYAYTKALNSKDIVAREAAFQRAAVDRREDAIPFLITEIKENGLLARFAPQYLMGIGKLTPAVESTLIEALTNSKDDVVRRYSAETLGYLRSHKAVVPLTQVVKVEKSYPSRAAYVQALGLIGDRSAIPALKWVLDDKTEIEFVRSRAALSLAQLGDPSGRAHLVEMIDSPLPQMQVLGMTGLVQLHDPEVLGYLAASLESQYEEVWTTAVQLIPAMGPAQALPVLRIRLEGPNELIRRRAALAMGFLGDDNAVPYIDRAVRVGVLQERIMGVELLAKLQRTDRIPLLIERLQDAHTLVRQAAAAALARLHATQAIPALVDAARSKQMVFELPGGMRGGAPDASEQLTMLSCIRMLRGEQGDIYISTLPNQFDQSWPEVDHVLSDQAVELLKMYELVDVIADHNLPVGAVLKTPEGKELLVREGETVAGGFKVRDMALPSTNKEKAKLPGYVTLMRGEKSVRLIIGKPMEIESKRAKQQ